MLGWSYGGLLAQCYALAYPQHCLGLILVATQSGLPEPVTTVDPAQRFISPAEQEAIDNVQKKVSEGTVTIDAQVIYNKNLAGDWKRYSYYKPAKEEVIRKALYEWSPAPGFEKLMRAESDTINLKGKFDGFKIPTLIIDAQWDFLLWWNPERADLMRKNHSHAQFEIFEKSGHKIFADEPDKFFSILKKFILSVQ